MRGSFFLMWTFARWWIFRSRGDSRLVGSCDLSDLFGMEEWQASKLN